MVTTIWWIRRDLRLNDNPALNQALTWGDVVVPVFILDPRLTAHAPPGRYAFLIECLRALDMDLRALGSSLVLRAGDPVNELSRLQAETDAACIYAEADYSPTALRRDKAVGSTLPLMLVHGLTIHPPGSVVKSDGSPYTIFTPFSRAWQSLPRSYQSIPPPDHLKPHQNLPSQPFPETKKCEEFPVCESSARQRLREFLDQAIVDYHINRDRLDLEGTSRLSPCFRFGLLSASHAYAQISDMLNQTAHQAGISAWLNELVWREFYIHILSAYPYVLNAAFRPYLRNIPWRDRPTDLHAWQSGLTGYPVVDAGMRQLAQTGWMHNRARMIAASFLTKDLLINWQDGEKWFLRHLLDGDPASNNGGWQWVAGTGTDAAPFFRIFNPVLQSRKFDPEGKYIRKWIPELASVPVKYIHEPWLMPPDVQSACGVHIGRDYPAPIVEHAAARERALAAYKTSA